MDSVPQHNPGVYAIYDIQGRRTYIGSTINTIRTRWNGHMSDLKAHKHLCVPLQVAWNTLGAANLRFTVLVPMPGQSEQAIRQAEQEQIELYRQQGKKLFNTAYNSKPIFFNLPAEPKPEKYTALSWEWCPTCGALIPERFGIVDHGLLFCSMRCWNGRSP